MYRVTPLQLKHTHRGFLVHGLRNVDLGAQALLDDRPDDLREDLGRARWVLVQPLSAIVKRYAQI